MSAKSIPEALEASEDAQERGTREPACLRRPRPTSMRGVEDVDVDRDVHGQIADAAPNALDDAADPDRLELDGVNDSSPQSDTPFERAVLRIWLCESMITASPPIEESPSQAHPMMWAR